MRTLIRPDFQNSIVNLSATVAEFLGCPNDKPVLQDLSRALKSGYKNVVLLIFDGLGMYPLEQNAEACSFLRSRVARVLTSVFPSTTTNATTSIRTNTYPMQHGWFGWSLYFEELHRAVDIFRDVDSFTGDPIEQGYSSRRLPTTPFYTHASTEYKIGAVVPPFWEGEEDRLIWNTVDEFFDHISAFCRREGKHFVYAYCTQPDSVMHEFGVTSAEARATIAALSKGVEALSSSLSDTLFLVTADHGQIDIRGNFALYEDEELLSLLECRPYLEARAAAFRVKERCREKFEALFREKYGKDFALFGSKELIRQNYFGSGNREHETLLGDYLAVGTTDKIFRLTPRSRPYKGHHTSLTEEMLVPLILIG